MDEPETVIEEEALIQLEIGKESFLAEFDRVDPLRLSHFLTQPLRRETGIIQCQLIRQTDSRSKSNPIYSLYLKVFPFFLCAFLL
jgi:hypothetical protein